MTYQPEGHPNQDALLPQFAEARAILATTPGLPVLDTQLPILRCVYAPNPDALAMDFNCVSVNDTSPAYEVFGLNWFFIRRMLTAPSTINDDL